MNPSDPFHRSSGVLLHPTSFESPYGIGDVGPAARDWVSFLVGAETKIWQILPLGPTGKARDSLIQSDFAIPDCDL